VWPETLQGVVGDVHEARAGEFPAYLKLVGYISGATSERLPMEITPAHEEMFAARMSHLRCNACGKYHRQSWVPTFDPVRERHSVAPVRCPYCGTQDCAGPKNHRIAGCRGIGKSEGVAAIGGCYDYGLLTHRGYVPTYIIIGSNKHEGMKRLAHRVSVMRRPGHRLAFPRATVGGKAGGQAVKCAGHDIVSIQSFGIESMPPGAHADILDADDVVNEDNTFTKPAKIDVVNRKVADVIDYSQKPWTIFNWYTTPWREGDADDKLEKFANGQPGEWVNHGTWVTGSREDGFIIPWENRWTQRECQVMYDKNEYSFRRAMMGQRITTGDVVFQQVGMWLRADDRNLGRAGPETIEGCTVVSEKELREWPRVLGVDLAFTGITRADGRPADTHNRSKTGFCITAVDPESKRQCILYTRSDFIRPGLHETEIAQIATEWHVTLIAIEVDKATDELVEALERKGYAVDLYSPVKLGSKIYRKMPVASMFNNRRAFVHGTLLMSEGRLQAIPFKQHAKLRETMLAFPSCERGGLDLLDSLEIAVRKGAEYYGGDPTESKKEARNEKSDFGRWRDSHYDDKPRKDADHDWDVAAAEQLYADSVLDEVALN
jgi:hypothetical protein